MNPRKFAKHFALATIAASLAACSAGQQSSQLPIAAAGPGAGSAMAMAAAHGGQRTAKGLRAFAADCSTMLPVFGNGLCLNIELFPLRVYGAGTPAAQVPGFHPADLQAAYKLPSTTAGSGQTIAVIVAGADPNIAADLAVYRNTFGLPACTTANGCLTIIAAKNNPGPDPTWAREAASDLDMASATCPACKLQLYIAKSTNDTDLAAAISAAIAAGATVVSNSYAIPESGSENAAMWSHPGVPIVAAAGDQGYGTASWPAAAAGSIAVGATTLQRDAATARGWSETAWMKTGSACSTVASKPAWQTDSGCTKRTVADVAAVGDPQTPVAVYNSYQDYGWVEVGGTSVATPIVAGAYALAANGSQLNGAASLYAHRANLFPVDAGSNGVCTTAYLCTAAAGYNGPAGLGTPNGIAAF